MKRKHPELYDGDILWLNKFHVDKDSFELTVSTSKFSQLLSLVSLKIDGFRCQFSFEALITNKNGKILFGERTHKSEYKPAYYQIPGGVLEKLDTEGSVIDACMREIKEEILISISPNEISAIALIPGSNETGVQFIISFKLNLDDTPLPANHEWENEILLWHSVDELISRYPQEKMLEGLKYVVSK